MFNVTMLPAEQGDSIWIEYGSARSPHRILIDCGTPPTSKCLRDRVEALGTKPSIDLLVITHIDTDHIGGALGLFDNLPAGLKVEEVWFNSWRHLAARSDLLGPIDGEILSALIDRSRFPWNVSLPAPDHAVCVPPAGDLVTRTIHGMKLTVVGPGNSELRLLKANWKKVVEAAGLAPGVPSQRLQELAKPKGVKSDLLGGDPIKAWADSRTRDLDSSVANGSSVAIFAEFDDGGVKKRLLLAGDAHGDALTAGIKRLADQLGQRRLRLDAFKLPHHGSLENVTRELVESVECPRFLFSTNGAGYYHPDKEAVARVVTYGSKPSTLYFNYRSEFNKVWDNGDWRGACQYKTEYGDGSLTVSL